MEQQPKKAFYKRWWFITLAVFIVLGVIGSKNEPSKQALQTEKQEAAKDTASSKQYVEIFKFSGTGTKKSEPFTVTGSRFKIAYDCSGDPSATLCTAFVFKVGSSLPQGVMNSVSATKDETVIYGNGEYYLDANVLGKFSMTVYDYK